MARSKNFRADQHRVPTWPLLVALTALGGLAVQTSASALTVQAKAAAGEPVPAVKAKKARRGERQDFSIDPTWRIRDTPVAASPAPAAAPRPPAPAPAPAPVAAAPAPMPAPAPAPPTPAAPAVAAVRVPYIPESLRQELKDEIRRDLLAQARSEGWAPPGAVPAWVRGVRFEGDVRLRFQSDRYAQGNGQDYINVAETNRTRTATALNTAQSRNRLRARARLGIGYGLDDQWSTMVRVSTGNTTDPVSSNQTLGTYGNKFSAVFDRAYVRYRHDASLDVVAGRMGNPWFGTDLVWANDLGFDGVAAQWTPRLSPTWRGFLTLGAMSVQEVELASDKWLLGAQLGAEASQLFGGASSGKLGLALYRYRNIVGRLSGAGRSDLEYTAPAFAQKGNTYFNISSDATRPLLGLASDYHLVNLTGSLAIPVSRGRQVVLTADHVMNTGFDRAAVNARLQSPAGAEVRPQTRGSLVRVAFGNAELKQLHDWQVFGAYKRVERDAVLDAFTDSDFRLGGTDAKGFIIGGSYGLGANASATLRLLSADSISASSRSSTPLSIDVVQFDVLLRY